MPIFTIDTETIGLNKRPSARTQVPLLFSVGLPIYFCISWLSSEPRGRNPSHLLLESILCSLILAVSIFAIQRFRAKKKLPPYELVIEGDEIESKTPLSILGFPSKVSRRVRRGQIKTIIERKDWLIVSERNRIWTFLRGGVPIPKKLPEYEYLKNLAISWKSESKV